MRQNFEELIKVDKNGHGYMLFKIDIYFSEYRLAVEVDEEGNVDRDLFFEKGKEILEKIVDCKFIRTNTSKKCYDLGDGSGSIPNLLLNQRKH